MLDSRAIDRLQTSSSRGAAIGAGLRGGFALFGLLLKSRKKGLNREDATSAAVATLRYTAFLGVFSGAYVLVDESLAQKYGPQRSKHWRAAVAGLLAGPSLMLTGQPHTSLAIYIHFRSLVLLARVGLKKEHPLLKVLLTPLRFEHGDVALMCAAAAQILYAWVCMPQTLPSSYIFFLNKHGAKNPKILRAMQGLTTASPAQWESARIAARDHHAAKGRAIDVLRDSTRPPLDHFHAAIHPGQTCAQHFVSFPFKGFFRSLPVYVPVYLVPMLLVHREKLLSMQKGAPILKKTAMGVVRSSLFLSMYCSLAWGGNCAFQHAVGHSAPATIAMGAWVSGLATFIEKKSRRMELALYCISRAAESFGECLMEWGYISPHLRKARVDIALFCLATSTIMHCYNTERDVFKSKYLNVLDWIFGNTGHSQQSIRHVPSNLQTITPYIEQVEKSAMGQHVIAPIKKALSFQNLASESNVTQPTPEETAVETRSPPHDQVKTA